MAVQAQFYSDHYQIQNNSNNNMGFSNLHQDWTFMPFGDDPLHQDSRFLDSQKMINSGSDLVSSSSSRRFGMNGFQNLGLEIERQKLEMDCFLHFQNEKLKSVLNEETRRREMIMLHNYESKMKSLIDAKDQLLTTATTRTKELQNYLQIAEKEAKNWETKAMETEAMVTDLNTKLKQARARRHEDAESVCNGGYEDETQRQKEKMVCKMCHVRSSCVLLLPCRHLCCCSHCEGLLMFCPVCETVKNGGLEVSFGPN